jgi:hypothetical protein
LKAFLKPIKSTTLFITKNTGQVRKEAITPTKPPPKKLKTKKRKIVVANHLYIVDDEGNPKIGMHASGKSGYAGLSFYKGKGKERYQALHIYISDGEGQGIIEFWHGRNTIGLSLGASQKGAGMSIFDPEGKHIKAVGTCYTDPELSGDGKKKRKPGKSKPKTKSG